MKRLLLFLVFGLALSLRAAEDARFFSLPIDEVGGKRLEIYGPDNPWSSVPLDLQTFGGVPFQLSSKLQLQGTGDAKSSRWYPTRYTGIAVGRRAARLHLLHGGNMSDTDGRPIAALRLHYADASTHTIFITYGVHMRDWWKHRTETVSTVSDTNSSVVWTGTSSDATKVGATHRLYKSTFDLPASAHAIERLDAFTLFGRCSPILLSMTVEAPTPGAPAAKPAPSADDTKFRDELVLTVTARGGQTLSGAKVRSFSLDAKGNTSPLARPDDTGQEPGVVPIDYPADAGRLRLTASVSARVSAELDLKPGPDGRLPREVAVELERGVRIGGIVRDAEGTPQAKAKVAIMGRRTDAAGKMISFRYEEDTTDAQGRWSTQTVPESLENVSFTVTQTGFRPVRYDIGGSGATNSVTRDVLLAGKAEFKFRPGLSVRGVVVDEAGEPLAGAAVTLVPQGSGLASRTRRTTDAEGRFSFSVASLGGMSLLVESPGLASTVRAFNISENMESMKITLAPGKLFKGRIFGLPEPASTDRQPLAGVAVTVSVGQGNLLRWTGTTDAEGRFQWEQAPTDELKVQAQAEGYALRQFTAKAQPTESEFLLTKLFMRWARVVDAETKQPVTNFTAMAGQDYSYSSERIYWQATQPIKGKDGAFALPDPNGQNSNSRFVMKVEAPGYWPQKSEPGVPSSQTNVFELRRSTNLTGVVQRPDGQPAAGAELAVIGEGHLNLHRGTFSNRYSRPAAGLVTFCDARGNFSLAPRLSERVVFVHESGYAESTLSNLATQATVKLQPWGIIEGLVKIGNQPATNAEVKVNESFDSGGLEYAYDDFDVKSDSAGRFRFTHVPPGARWIIRLIPTDESSRMWSHQTPVHVEPGQTATVTVGGTGRPVIGKVVADDPAQKIAWTSGNHSISKVQPNYPSYRTAEEYQQWNRSAEGKALRANNRYYAIVFASDGTFRADDVPPGQYTINFHFTEPRVNDQPSSGASIGQVSGRQFEVGALPGGRSDEPLDLGTFTLKTNRRQSANR